MCLWAKKVEHLLISFTDLTDSLLPTFSWHPKIQSHEELHYLPGEHHLGPARRVLGDETTITRSETKEKDPTFTCALLPVCSHYYPRASENLACSRRH